MKNNAEGSGDELIESKKSKELTNREVAKRLYEDVYSPEARQRRSDFLVYRKKLLESVANILFSETDDDKKIKAITSLEGEKLDFGWNIKKDNEVELLSSAYKHETSPNVRKEIIKEIDFHSNWYIPALDTIVLAAKSDKDESVRNFAIKILKKLKTEGFIDAVINEKEDGT